MAVMRIIFQQPLSSQLWTCCLSQMRTVQLFFYKQGFVQVTVTIFNTKNEQFITTFILVALAIGSISCNNIVLPKNSSKGATSTSS